MRYRTDDVVAVLGSGPAGLLAAHALVRHGRKVAIFSRPEPSVISGAQFLHAPIPGLTDSKPDFMIRNITVGTIDGYRNKVYGHKPGVIHEGQRVSIGHAQKNPSVQAWSMPGIYERLWDAFGPVVTPVEDVKPLLPQLLANYAAVVSSVPLRGLCNDPSHTFASVTIRVLPEPPGDVPENTVITDGTPYVSWYRASRIQGCGGREYAEGSKIPPGTAGRLVEISKPTWNTCLCHPGMIRVGRYGLWQKGILAHQAFNDVCVHMQEYQL